MTNLRLGFNWNTAKNCCYPDWYSNDGNTELVHAEYMYTSFEHYDSTEKNNNNVEKLIMEKKATCESWKASRLQ